jgi:hypothetical protein
LKPSSTISTQVSIFSIHDSSGFFKPGNKWSKMVPTTAAPASSGSIRIGGSVAAGGRWFSLRCPKLGLNLRSRRSHEKKAPSPKQCSKNKPFVLEESGFSATSNVPLPTVRCCCYCCRLLTAPRQQLTYGYSHASSAAATSDPQSIWPETVHKKEKICAAESTCEV